MLRRQATCAEPPDQHYYTQHNDLQPIDTVNLSDWIALDWFGLYRIGLAGNKASLFGRHTSRVVCVTAFVCHQVGHQSYLTFSMALFSSPQIDRRTGRLSSSSSQAFELISLQLIVCVSKGELDGDSERATLFGSLALSVFICICWARQEVSAEAASYMLEATS